MKKYCCFPFKKKEQSQNEDFIEAEIVEAEFLNKTNEIMIKPEYIFIKIEKNSKLIVRNYTAFPLFRKYKA